jgi:hypothetical protein
MKALCMFTHTHLCTFMISRWILLRVRNISNRSHTEHQNTLHSQLPFLANRAFLWDKFEKCGKTRQATDGNVIRSMGFACWVTMDTHTHADSHTHTHRIYNTYCFSTAKMVTLTRLNVTFICTLPDLFRVHYGWFICHSDSNIKK